MMRSAMRLCLRVQAGFLGTLGIYLLWVFVRATAEEKLLGLMICSTALLLPGVLYLFTLTRYLRDDTQERGAARPARAGVSAIPLVLSVALYLPLMILMASELREWKWALGPIPLFLVLWLFCACAYACLRGERTAVFVENGGASRVLGRCLDLTSRYLSAPVVLLLGAVLLAGSVQWAGNDEFALFGSRGAAWITAEYGLGNHISATKAFLDGYGRFVYLGSLLVAACTVVLLVVSRFSGARLRTSRTATAVGLAVAFLAIASLSDYYFAWLSFLLDGKLPWLNWILFALFFLHWTLPLMLAVAFLRARDRTEQTARLGLKTLAVFYAPLLLFDLAMTPFFANDFPSRFILSTFLGLQFLAWGYLQARHA